MNKNNKEMSVLNVNQSMSVNFKSLRIDKREFPEYLESPYEMIGIIEKNVTKKGKYKELVDTSTGEIHTYQELDKSDLRYHDPSMYTKYFVGSATSVLRHLTFHGVKLFLYILDNLRPHKDIIFLNMDDVVLWCSFGRSTYFSAVKELMYYDIIAAKLGSRKEFFTNPNVVFNGSRTKLYEAKHKRIK